MRIIHPRPELGRQSSLGVDFIDGAGTVESLHPERELALLQHGYTIEKDIDVEAPYHGGLGEPIIDLTTLTVAELRDIADTEGIDLPSRARKDEIIDLISCAPAEPIEYVAAGYENSPPIPEGFGAVTLDGEPALPIVELEPGVTYAEAFVEVTESD